MNNYKITVVVPTYNTGKGIYDLFDSIKSQTMGFENIEVIFVDDNSPDEETLAILSELDSYSNVSVVKLKENSGFPGRGRNIGLDMAKGEFVIFCDHDDTYNEGAFERMYDEITSNGADLVFTNYFRVYPDRKDKEKTVFDGENIIIGNVEEDLRLFELSPSIWTKLFRKEFLTSNNISFLEGMLGEDLELFIHAILLSNKTIYLDDFYSYNYSIRDSDEDKSTIHLRNKLIFSKMIEGYYKTEELLSNLNKEEYFDLVFKKHFVYFLTNLVKSNISDDDKRELLIAINPILKRELLISPNLDERIFNGLARHLSNNQIDEAVKEMNKIKKIRRIKNKVKSFLKF
ncbi:MAG: glycosyltransferase family 2 protein [Methanobrevibacter sp.]|uniref:glycosyltransferase family 2 protein n=1 Tax=Methanobrevibacter sp. TaxID=66852 RepID=UPI0026DF75A3|nr:glycosyltransferase family 2 protein [Methanobrevibacter sp.]MDO5848650.1 glycosyltransferase family 2 protein [Methanobrevibacter sp.]